MIPYLSYSQLSVLRKCGEQYRRKYIEREPVPSNIPQMIGRATHRAAEQNLTKKMETGELLPAEAVIDAAVDAFDQEKQQDFALTEDEKDQGQDKVLGLAKDSVVVSAKVHHENFAPQITPISVEEKIVVPSQWGVDLMAIIDVVDMEGDHTTTLRDLKVRRKRPVKNEALTSFQLSFYDFVTNEAAHPADRFAIDTIVFGTKTPSVSVESARRDDEDRRVVASVIERAIEVIEKGAFVPTDPGNWWCSNAYCWYATTCPFFAGRKTIGVK